MRRLFHYRPRQADRVPRPLHIGHRPRPHRRPVHNRRVQLVRPIGGKHRTAPGVEERIILQQLDRRFHAVQRCAALVQNSGGRIQSFFDSGAIIGFRLRRHRAALDHPRPAMQHNRPLARRRRGLRLGQDCAETQRGKHNRKMHQDTHRIEHENSSKQWKGCLFLVNDPILHHKANRLHR